MRILLSLVLLVLLAGCASNQTSTAWSHQAWVDDKNHYHPEWVYGINTPGDYPREMSDHTSVGEYLGKE